MKKQFIGIVEIDTDALDISNDEKFTATVAITMRKMGHSMIDEIMEWRRNRLKEMS